jgi:hypothetical protein
MTEHLPECLALLNDSTWDGDCICDALRACEQRVAEETEAAMMESFYWKPSPPHDQHYFADNICAYCVGQREMLDGCIAVILSMKDSDECEHSYCRTLDAVAKGVRRAIEEKP